MPLPRFYKEAVFYTTEEVAALLRKVGYVNFAFRQTVFQSLSVPGDAEPVEEGFGRGAFVVVRGQKGALNQNY